MYDLKEMTLLYIEDDEVIREKFVHFLKPKFKEVFEAVDGVEALEKYHAYCPDMIVVDINLPKLDGLEVIEHIRKHDIETPIVVLSGYSDQIKLLKAIRLGLSDYLVKPVPRQKLLSFIEEEVFKDEITATTEFSIAKRKDIGDRNAYYCPTCGSWIANNRLLAGSTCVYVDEKILEC